MTVGFEASVCRREDSMCEMAVREGTHVALADASTDTRFARNPFVTGEMALEPLKVILAIYESARRSGARVEI